MATSILLYVALTGWAVARRRGEWLHAFGRRRRAPRVEPVPAGYRTAARASEGPLEPPSLPPWARRRLSARSAACVGAGLLLLVAAAALAPMGACSHLLAVAAALAVHGALATPRPATAPTLVPAAGLAGVLFAGTVLRLLTFFVPAIR